MSIWLAPALLLALGACVILFDGLGIEGAASNQLFDAYQRHAARTFVDAPALPVRVLELPSLDEDNLVKVTRTLIAQGAHLIVFTAPLDAAASPQSMAARLPPGSDAARAALTKLPEPGHDLAAEIIQTKAVVPVMLGVAGREPHIKARFVYRGTSNPFGHLPRFGAAAGAQTVLETNAAGSAAANLIPDSDGVLRRMPLVFQLGNTLVPGMAAEVLRVAMSAIPSPSSPAPASRRWRRRQARHPPTAADACGCILPPMSPSACSIPMRSTREVGPPCRSKARWW